MLITEDLHGFTGWQRNNGDFYFDGHTISIAQLQHEPPPPPLPNEEKEKKQKMMKRK